jgi:AraC-like DNA-binding protein
MDLRHAGAPYYPVTSSATVSEALHNLSRYSRVASEAILFELSPQKNGVVLTSVPVRRYNEPRRQYSEFVALVVLRALHAVTNRKLSISMITFAHSRDSCVKEVAYLLGCPVEFARTDDSWVLPESAMELAIVSSDTQLLEILREHADHLVAEKRAAGGLQNVLEKQLVRLLPGGRAQAALVARQLGMSTRSFTRHLAEEGTTFSEVLDELRERLALEYLTDARISLQQVAWLLGYSEIAAFNHAFKRWTGTSPGRVRNRPLAT